MKCEVCLELLEEYFDGELAADSQARVSEHLLACTDCSTALETLTAEQQLFARYDREIEVPPFLFTRIAEHAFHAKHEPRRWRWPSLAGVAAILLLAIAIGFVYLIAKRPATKHTVADSTPKKPIEPPKESVPAPQPDLKNQLVASKPKRKARVAPTPIEHTNLNQSDIISSDLGYLDLDERDTAKHIEQTQILLRSIRNFPVSDTDEEIDVTYDKALSRRLLNENVVLRREAEMKAKFPTKTLLADLEPFLIDIANLPDHAKPEDVRVIKERVQKTEIVAALLDYQDRSANNR